MKSKTCISIATAVLSSCKPGQSFMESNYRRTTTGFPGRNYQKYNFLSSETDAVTLFAVSQNPEAPPVKSFWDELSDKLDEEGLEDVLAIVQEVRQPNGEPILDEDSSIAILRKLATSDHESAPDLADRLLRYMTHRSEKDGLLHPTARVYNVVILIWSESFRRGAGKKCCEYLDSLWSLHVQTKDSRFIPLRSSYISSITALSRSRNHDGAEQAEELLKDMTRLRQQYPELSPNTICVNGVLNAWSKSGIQRGAATRCERLLDNMIREFEAGRTELQPNASSFNSVLDALAKSSEDESENRAEALLRKMEDLASNNMYLSSTCRPDHVSFNIVINGWAQSRSREGAKRATSILKHMEQRYSTENTEIHPDAASYTTVINAWSRSRDNSAVKYAEEVLQWAEKAQDRGDLDVNLSTLAYNSMINCYAKSSLPGAADRALSILEMLKVRGFEQKQDQFKPDIVTYTSVIDTLAKQSTLEASEKAEALLNEVESAFEQSGDMRLKPNIRTYTSVVNAIGRSRKKPQRAESILNRVQAVCDTGNSMVKPDVVFFNALINAYGWSTEEGKSAKCYEILNVMIDLHASKENIDAKPDIVTCNSVLNACAFEKTRSEMDHEEIMNIVVETLETFQQSAPKYGYPDHATYAQVLLAISNHMPMSNKRVKLAEATFWQCCKSGNVSVMVISNLKTALPWDRFAALLGPALKSKKGTKLRFDADKLPSSWVRHNRSALRKKTYSRPSRKRNNGYHVTKQSLSKMKSANPA